MFSFLKKQIHDNVEIQYEDLRNEALGPVAFAGEDCDEISGGTGPFGLSPNNPIPVNGLIGTYKYLGKLLSSDGVILYFHRLGSVRSDKTCELIDAYEVVDINGNNWDILFIDMYHPRRSNKTPTGYQHKEYSKKTGDIPFTFGVDVFCQNFPFDLGDAIESRNSLPAFARHVRERVACGGFERPSKQSLKVHAVLLRLVSSQ